MIEMSVDIPTPDGAMNSYIFHPERDGPHPVVILYMDALGLREELSDMSRRIASVGYYVLMPNLYYRSARSIDVDGRRMQDPAYAERVALMWQYNRALTNAMVDRDTEDAVRKASSAWSATA
ncbi:MAG: dienelactone hydrolase family protein [Burkholderiaceae bacterium]